MPARLLCFCFFLQAPIFPAFDCLILCLMNISTFWKFALPFRLIYAMYVGRWKTSLEVKVRSASYYPRAGEWNLGAEPPPGSRPTYRHWHEMVVKLNNKSTINVGFILDTLYNLRRDNFYFIDYSSEIEDRHKGGDTNRITSHKRTTRVVT